MLPNETDPYKPSDAQKLSDRTVFRFQQIANLLKEDLDSLPGLKGKLLTVLFAQRDWKHSKSSSGSNRVERYYNANLCATFHLTGTALEELRAAAKGVTQTGAVTQGQLKALFAAYNLVSKEGDHFDRFSAAVATSTQLEEAHRLLVEAASAIPYRGQLPAAFDTLLTLDPKSPVGFWFTGRKKSTESRMQFSYRALKKLRSSPSTKVKKLIFGKTIHDISLVADAPDLKHHEESLRIFFDDFLNPLLVGASTYAVKPPTFSKQSAMTGLAFPCFERTGDEDFSGAFLGWLFFIVSADTSYTSLPRSWDSFRFAVNQFADRILDATIDEVLGEYGKRAKRGDAPEPEEAFKEYLPRIEGWLTNGSMKNFVLPLPGRNGSPVQTPISAKRDTLHTEPGLSLALLLRCHRLFRGLAFVYDNSQVESLKKYQQMMALLERPLSIISNALAEVQSSTQELRAVLYEPSKALFESYSLLTGLFTENAKLQPSKFMREIPVSHNGEYTGEVGKVVLAVALCRIFGRDKELEGQRTAQGIIDHAKEILTECENRDRASFGELVDDLIWLLELESGLAIGPSKLASILDEDPNKPMQTIKQVLFAPFKLHTRTWNLRAVVLAVRSCGLREGLKHDTLPAEWQIDERFSPCSYHALLAFLADIAAHTKNNKDCGYQITEILCPQPVDATEWVLRLSFKRAWFSPENVGLLHETIYKHVLGSPRDWRVYATNAGNFRKPFIDLAGRLLGIAGEGKDGWRRRTAKATPSCYEIISVQHPKEERSFTVSARETSGEYNELEVAWRPIRRNKAAQKSKAKK